MGVGERASLEVEGVPVQVDFSVRSGMGRRDRLRGPNDLKVWPLPRVRPARRVEGFPFPQTLTQSMP
jgi:hypothetical protein